MKPLPRIRGRKFLLTLGLVVLLVGTPMVVLWPRSRIELSSTGFVTELPSSKPRERILFLQNTGTRWIEIVAIGSEDFSNGVWSPTTFHSMHPVSRWAFGPGQTNVTFLGPTHGTNRWRAVLKIRKEEHRLSIEARRLKLWLGQIFSGYSISRYWPDEPMSMDGPTIEVIREIER